MKCGKAAVPSSIVAEMLKAAGEERIETTDCFQWRHDPI